MNRSHLAARIAATAASAAFAFSLGTLPARAADESLALSIDGRPMSHASNVALIHDGSAFVDLTTIVRTFNGLLSIEPASSVATIDGHRVRFAPGDKTARVDGVSTVMPAAPFRANGTLYVPLRFFTAHLVPQAKVNVDRAAATASLDVPIFAN
ncbi:MAG: hypothetical protein NVS1B2_06580 [Vulcanimicrobiaceae bacterium]